MKKIVIGLGILFLSMNTFGQREMNYSWSDSYGGTGTQTGHTLATFPNGDLLVAGSFTDEISYPVAGDIFTLPSNGDRDIFVQRLNATKEVIWMRTFGGVGADFIQDIAIDDSGNIYGTGSFTDTVDFDPNIGVTNFVSKGWNDAYVFKWTGEGHFIWATTAGGEGFERGKTIVVNQSNEIYFGGNFTGTVDFSTTLLPEERTSNGSSDVFIAKLDATGSLIWVNQYGGTGLDEIIAIELSQSEDLLATGVFKETVDFDASLSTSELTSAGEGDIFLIKLWPIGTLKWLKQIGGVEIDSPNDLEICSNDDILLSGSFRGTTDLDPGGGVVAATGTGLSGFLLKLNNQGEYIWSALIDSDELCLPSSIEEGTYGTIYVGGVFTGTVDLDPSIVSLNYTSTEGDLFMQRFSSIGSLDWAGVLTGVGYEDAREIREMNSGEVLLMGNISETVDVDPNSGVELLTPISSDFFLLELDATDLGFQDDVFSVEYDFCLQPNPSNGTFEVIASGAYKDQEVAIYSLVGRLVYRTHISGETKKIMNLNLPNGTYLVNIEGHTEKLIIR